MANPFRGVVPARAVRTLVVLACAWLSAATCVQAAPAKPNVLIFLADDQGWGDLSCHGNTNLLTPNIDALARDGALLN